MPLHFFVCLFVFCGGFVCFCFPEIPADYLRGTSEQMRWWMLSLSFRLPETPPLLQTSMRVQARVHRGHRDSAARVPSSLVTILWVQRLLKEVSNLLKVRLPKQRTENKAACVPLSKAAKPAGKHRGFWETVSIHSGFTPQAWELKKHVQLAVNWG